MESISQYCTPLFQGLGFLGPPVDFEMDPTIKPVHAPIHRQPTPNYEKIESALDTCEAQIGFRTWSSENGTPLQPSQERIRTYLDPSQTLNKAILQPKYIIPTFEENLHKLHGMRYMTIIQGSVPEHPPRLAIISHDHNVHTMGPLHKTTIWYFLSL